MKRRIKNVILKAVTVIAFIVMLVCITAIDTEGTNIFYVGLLASSAWLFTFAYANGYFDSIFVKED